MLPLYNVLFDLSCAAICFDCTNISLQKLKIAYNSTNSA